MPTGQGCSAIRLSLASDASQKWWVPRLSTSDLLGYKSEASKTPLVSYISKCSSEYP